MAPFDYEAAKTQFGGQRAREMEKEANAAGTPAPAPGGPGPIPAAPTPTAPTPGGPQVQGGPAYQGASFPAPPTAFPTAPDMSGFSGAGGFEKWSAANKAAGGTGDRTAFEQQMGLWKPGTAPAAGGAAPATSSASLLGRPGTGTDEQRQTAVLPPGTFPDDSPDAGKANTGDPYLDELRSGRVAGSEDWRRFSNAELKAWEPYYLGGGKFRNEYGDIVDKPVDSGPNTPGFNAGGGGGGTGGGGGGAAAGAGLSTGPAAPAGNNYSGFNDPSGQKTLDDSSMKALQGMIDGTGTRYTPEVMQGILAQVKQQMEGAASRQTRQARADAASRGVSRSGRTAAAVADIRRGAEAGFTSEYAGLLTKKVDADFQDKIAGLDRAQKYLDSLRDNLYRNDLTAMQREQFKANLALAYANIDAQRKNLQTSLNAQAASQQSSQQNAREMQRAGAGYSFLGGGV